MLILVLNHSLVAVRILLGKLLSPPLPLGLNRIARLTFLCRNRQLEKEKATPEQAHTEFENILVLLCHMKDADVRYSGYRVN